MLRKPTSQLAVTCLILSFGASPTAVLAFGMATGQGPTTNCVDTAGFSDAYGTCATYLAKKWCDASGGPGTGWDPTWGAVLDPDVVASCCACGKLRAAATTNASTVPTGPGPGRGVFERAASNWWYGPSQYDYGGSITKYGPDDWDQQWDTCGSDTDAQSPINLVQAAVDPSLGRLELKVKEPGCVRAQYVNTDYYWKVITGGCGNASVLTYKGKDWVLQQFHWHSPSEHSIGGGFHDMECHMVHKTKGGSTLVMAIFLSAQTHVRNNTFLSEFWSDSAFNNQFMTSTKGLNPYEGLLPADPTYFAYKGSSTSPPCVLNVEWIVFKSAVLISTWQLDVFRKALANMPMPDAHHDDTRPIQTLGKRVLRMGGFAPSS